MQPAAERRAGRRVPIDLRVEVSSDGRAIAARHTRDLSVRGVFVKTAEVLGQGRGCRVVLHPAPSLGEPGHPEIHVEGRVSRIEKSGLAVEFTEITMPSYVALQRLLDRARGREQRAPD